MSATPSLLIELLVEELPPKALRKLGDAFAQTIESELRARGLLADDSKVTSFASPRRLGALLTHVAARAADRSERQKLVPVKIGLDDAGKATAVLLKKLAAIGLGEDAVARLVRESDGKNETLFLDVVVPGAALQEALQQAFDAALAKLPIPKVMSYQVGDGWTTVKFVRPAHGIVALHGSEVVPIAALGLTAGRVTKGHRFESKEAELEIRSAGTYADRLAVDGAVLASFAERRADIERQLRAKAPQGLSPIDDDALLDEVTALVERPNVLLCAFESEFLAVPQECLILTMKLNQKYFPLLDAQGKLTNQFLVVSNIRPQDPSAIVSGNERVVRPRLGDAKFFFDQDRKKTLTERLPGLEKVVYHNKLGNQLERVQRVRQIAAAIGRQLGGDALAQHADRAAQLAKADLLTEMVGEFPELQGIMGGYYARHDGETDDLAAAIEDHYKPRFAGDELPRNPIGICVALADKLETLVGLFGIGQVPTGDKDPFALRRHALGVIRMLVERQLPLQLDELIALAIPTFGDRIEAPQQSLATFVFDRLAGSLREQGYTAQEVDAVLSLQPQRLAEIGARLAAVRAFAALPEAEALAAANKRIGNILKKSDGGEGSTIDAALLKEDAERQLADALAAVRATAAPLFASGDHQGALAACAALRTPVDAFFEAVMVNADDPDLRRNRLALLRSLHELMNTVADLSRLAT